MGNDNLDKPLTLTFLGCGTLGTAILAGVLDALAQHNGNTTTSDDLPPIPTAFSACVRSVSSADRIRTTLAPFPLASSVTIYSSNNATALQTADIILLGCKPYMAADLLKQHAEALSGKLLLSICAGLTLATLATLVPASTRVVRVMPNTAAKIRESMTVIAAGPRVTYDEMETVKWVFEGVGRAMVVPDEKLLNAATAICGSGPAFFALLMEAMVDGGVMVGVPRPVAQEMAAQTMLGTGKMVLGGLSPATIREQVSTPGGCTIAGLLRMEDGNVRSAMARAVEEATMVAGGLGAKK